jgi:hypothetical protein
MEKSSILSKYMYRQNFKMILNLVHIIILNFNFRREDRRAPVIVNATHVKKKTFSKTVILQLSFLVAAVLNLVPPAPIRGDFASEAELESISSKF